MKNLIAFILLFLPFMSEAQRTHTVEAKESLFSIGRKYDVHPRELASYNNIPFETGLTIGQVLKIPAKKSMAPIAETAAPAKPAPATVKPTEQSKGSHPVYHTVVKSEGLYGISKRYNVTIDEIKKWNNLNSDGLVEGMQLIVGKNGSTPATVAATPEKEEPVQVKPTEIKQATPAPAPVKETPKAARPDEVKKVNGGYGGGAFKSLYEAQASSKSVAQDKGLAGIFKSTSGWEDGKYYCLHNEAPAGSYVKITNPATQKSVYAKVLDLIPDLSENKGLIIRISNAAAAELGASTGNFDCTLQF
jgi:LysM repeat protein